MTRENGRRAAYTLEFNLEAVRLVHGGQAKVVTSLVTCFASIGGLDGKTTPIADKPPDKFAALFAAYRKILR